MNEKSLARRGTRVEDSTLDEGMLRFIAESDSFDRWATNRHNDDRLHGTLRVPTQRKENREARSHTGSSRHATTQRESKPSKHTAREATKG